MSNRKRLCLGLPACCFVLFAISTVQAQRVIELRNPDFEEHHNGPTYKEVLIDGQWTTPQVRAPQPTGWRTRVWTGNVHAVLDNRIRHKGKRSVRIESLANDGAGSGGVYQQIDYNLREGQFYTLVFHVKKTPLAEIGASIWSDGGAQFQTQANWNFNANFTEWQKIEYTFEASKTSTKGFWVVFKLKGGRGERAWFDDVLMHEGVIAQAVAPSVNPDVTRVITPTVQARGYSFFEITNFETVLPSHKPERLKSFSTVHIDACPGEFAAATFGIHAIRDTSSLTIDASDLVGESGLIRAAEVDLRVVKCWKQRRPRWTSQPPPTVVLPEYMMPELLLKDDAWNADNRPRGFDPDIRLTGPVSTRLSANTSKQIWMTVQVPSDTAPGRYTGYVTIESASDAPASRLELTVNVLPFRLAEANKIFGAYVNKGYTFNRDPKLYPQARYESKLRDLRDHGLNALPILDGLDREQVDGEWVLRWDDVRTALAYNKSYGLDAFQPFQGFMWAMLKATYPLYKGEFKPETNALLQWYTKELNQALQTEGFRPVTYYMVDEPHIYDDGIKRSQTFGQLFHQAGGLTTTAVTYHTWHKLKDAIDIPILDVGLEARQYLQSLADGKAQRQSEHPLLCYWQFWEEYPLFNRLQFGYFLWASGLDGVIPYGYQHFGGSGDPYDDFDHSNKDMFVAYPSKHGPVATLQWEACREGITDLRYLNTLIAAINAAKSASVNPEAVIEADRFLEALRKRIQVVPRIPVQDPPSAEEYVSLRRQIIGHILALRDTKEAIDE